MKTPMRKRGIRPFTVVVLSFLFTIVSAQAATVKWNPYGFIKANGAASTHAVDSFGNANMSAPVAARPSSELDGERARHTFQVAQSRLGIRADVDKVSGTVEVDFIDFTKASPTTKAFPRLRIAKIEYRTNEHNTFSLGQDWDIFSPSKPFTYNFVGLYFEAGNAGFMRHQFKWDYQNDGWHSVAGMGLLAANNAAADSSIEKNSYPTFAYRLSKMLAKINEFGGSIIGSATKSAGDDHYRKVFGLNVFNELHLSSGPQIHSELYWGQNLGNAGLLTLQSAATNVSRHEWGGYVSGTVNFCEHFGALGGLGAAFVSEAAGSPTDVGAAYTVRKNFKQELGLEYRPEENLKIFIQDTLFETHYDHLAVKENAALANVVELGMILNI